MILLSDMTYKIIIDPEAIQDMEEIIIWYEEKKNGLGKRFYRNFRDALDFIQRNPYSFAKRYKESRSINLKTFPIAVHYLINETQKTIAVLAVLHNRINPIHWKKRI